MRAHVDRVPTLRAVPTLEAIKAHTHPARVNQRESVTLAFDLSSSCIGWAVGTTSEVIAYGKFIFADRVMGAKLDALIPALLVLFETFKPKRVAAERPMAHRGPTTALHNQILGIVRLVAYQHSKLDILDVNLLSPRAIKKRLGVVKGRNHDHNKVIMVEYVNKVLGLNLKFHPNSKLQSQDDVADALAVLLALAGKAE